MKVIVRAYQIVRRAFHPIIRRTPRFVHHFFDIPCEKCKDVHKHDIKIGNIYIIQSNVRR